MKIQKSEFSITKLRIEPVFDGTNTTITEYSVVDSFGNVWMIGKKRM